MENEAGTYGQYLTSWVLADGDLRSLAKLLVGGLANAAKLDSLLLTQLKNLVRNFTEDGASEARRLQTAGIDVRYQSARRTQKRHAHRTYGLASNVSKDGFGSQRCKTVR